MKKLLLLLSVIFFCNIAITAQDIEKTKFSKFTIHSDVASLGIVHSISINTEIHLLTSKSQKVNLYGNLGYSRVIVDFFGKDYYNGANTALTILVRKNNHHFETNAGLHTAFESNPDTSSEYRRASPIFVPILNVGYRYQRPGEGIIFRVKAGTLGIGIGLGIAF